MFFNTKSLLRYNFITFLFLLTGCVEATIGAGSSVGLAALEERSARRIAEDIAIASNIRLNLINANKQFITGVGVEVFEARVLVTGVLSNERLLSEAVEIAWDVKGVENVLNEIQLGKFGIRDLVTDSWISTQLTSKITFDRDILAINYKIETVNGIIYLIGLAQHTKELNKVFAHAKSIKSVKRVISHVRVKQVDL